jgi:hypothetical protein
MCEYSATVGATDGNIIAAIITTQTPRNQASVRGRCRPVVHAAHAIDGEPHASAASANRSAISRSWRALPRKPACSPSAPTQSRGQAAHENCEELRPDFALYSIAEQADVRPKSLGRHGFPSPADGRCL